MKKILFVLCILQIYSCFDKKEDLVVEGWTPVYIQFDATKIKSEAPQKLVNGSNFILYKTYIMIVDKGEGIHIVDNTVPATPVYISYIKIPTVTQLTASEDILYVDVGVDLILIDISDIRNVKYLSSVKDFFKTSQTDIAGQVRGYFECVDNSKGIVRSWERKTLVNPKCRVGF